MQRNPGNRPADGVLAVGRAVLLAVAWLTPATAAERPGAFVPEHPHTVLERLPPGYGTLAPAGGEAIAQADIDRMLAIAGRSGDARLVSRAGRLLDRAEAGSDTPAALRARAYVAQYRHDFRTALALLDRAVAADPRDAGARLSRAQLQLVTGDLAGARRDCAALLLVDAGTGGICVGGLALRQGAHAQAIRLADDWLAHAPGDDPARRHVLLLRAEAASRAEHRDADAWFRQALATDPLDVRTLAAFARHLRTTGRPARVLALLRDTAATDTLALERVLAAHAAAVPASAALAAAQAERYAAAERIGIEAELREKALFELVVRGNADRALQLAALNFRTQRDHEDAAILVRAANAAGRPEALAPLRAWSAANAVPMPAAAP